MIPPPGKGLYGRTLYEAGLVNWKTSVVRSKTVPPADGVPPKSWSCSTGGVLVSNKARTVLGTKFVPVKWRCTGVKVKAEVGVIVWGFKIGFITVKGRGSVEAPAGSERVTSNTPAKVNKLLSNITVI